MLFRSELALAIAGALAKTKGESIQTPRLEEPLFARIEKIKTLDHLWKLASELISESGLSATDPKPPAAFDSPTKLQPSNQTEDQKIADGTEQKKDAIPLGAVDGIADRVTDHLGISRSEVIGTILRDLAWIHSFISGRQEPETIATFFADLMSVDETIVIPDDLSDFISQIDAAGTTTAKKFASQLAFA